MPFLCLTSCVAQSVSHGAPGMRRGRAGWNLVVMLGHTWDCLAHPTTSASFWLRLLSLTRQVPPEMTLEQLQRHMKGPLTGLQYLTWWKWKRAVNAAVNICKGLCVWTRRTSVAQGSWLNFTRKTIIIKKKRWRRRAADKRPTQFVWTKQTNLFFTLTYSKYHTVGCNDDMPRFTHVSVCAGYVIIILHRLHLSHNLNHKIDKRPNCKKKSSWFDNTVVRRHFISAKRFICADHLSEIYRSKWDYIFLQLTGENLFPSNEQRWQLQMWF